MFKGSRYLFQGPSFWGPPAVSFAGLPTFQRETKISGWRLDRDCRSGAVRVQSGAGIQETFRLGSMVGMLVPIRGGIGSI